MSEIFTPPFPVSPGGFLASPFSFYQEKYSFKILDSFTQTLKIYNEILSNLQTKVYAFEKKKIIFGPVISKTAITLGAQPLSLIHSILQGEEHI